MKVHAKISLYIMYYSYIGVIYIYIAVDKEGLYSHKLIYDCNFST